MAGNERFSIKVDLAQAALVEEYPERIGPERLRDIGRQALEFTALEARKDALLNTHNYLNLTRDYIEKRIERAKPETGALREVLSSRVEGATMQNFGMAYRTRAVNWDNDTIEDEIVSQGKGTWARPDEKGTWKKGVWYRRDGDTSHGRGIVAGDKAAGVYATIFRGKGPTLFKQGFFKTLKNGNGIGLFMHRSSGATEHAIGPSVYQTFRHFITVNEAAITNMLQTQLLGGLDKELEAQ